MTGLPLSRWQLVALTLGVGIVTLASVAPDRALWLGSWSETGAALESASLLLYPLLAAWTAWVAGAPRRRRFLPLLLAHSRNPASPWFRAALMLASSAAMGFLLVAGALLVYSGQQADFGHPPWGALASVVAGTFAVCGLGVLAGRYLPSVAAPLGVAMLLYGLSVWADSGNPHLEPLAGLLVADSRERTYLATDIWAYAVRTLWLLSIGTAATMLAGKFSKIPVIPLASASVTAALLLFAGTSTMSVQPGSYVEVCDQGSQTVCLTAARHHVSASVMSATALMFSQLSGLGDEVTLVEEPLSPQPAPILSDGKLRVPFSVVNGVHGEAHQVDPTALVIDISNRLLRSNCQPTQLPDPTSPPLATATDVIQAWLLDRLGLPLSGYTYDQVPLTPDALNWTPAAPFRSWWEGLQPQQRHEWFRKHGQDLLACRVSLTPGGS